MLYHKVWMRYAHKHIIKNSFVTTLLSHSCFTDWWYPSHLECILHSFLWHEMTLLANSYNNCCAKKWNGLRMYTQIKNLPVSTFSHTLLFHNLEKFNSFSRVSLCPYVIHTIRLKLEIHCEHATFWFCKPNKKRKCLVAKNRKAPLLLCTFLSPICVLQEVFSSSQWEAA